MPAYTGFVAALWGSKMAVLVDISVPLSQTVEWAEAEKERVILTRDGRPVAALVPVADVAALEMIEDTADTAAAVAALTEWEAAGRPPGGDTGGTGEAPRDRPRRTGRVSYRVRLHSACRARI